MPVASWMFGHVLMFMFEPAGRTVNGPLEVAPGAVEGPAEVEGPEAEVEGPAEAGPRGEVEGSEARPSAPTVAEATPPALPERPEQARRDTLLWTNYVGLGGGARWGRREVGPLDVPEDRSGRETTATGLGGIQGRLAGYSSAAARIGAGLRLITPELFAALELGGTRRGADGMVAGRRGGVDFGAQGVLRIGVGRAMSRRVSPYGKLQLDQRFALHYRDSAEGNHYTAALRASAGIFGRTRKETVVVLAGGAVDGVAGAQALGRRSAVLQAMAGAELAIYVNTTPHVMLAWVGEARTTLAGERFGGRRTEGRATFDVMIGGPSTRQKLRYLSLLAMFTATEIRASPSSSPITSAGERRIGYAALLGVGVAI